jgi:hypothetical protein
VLWICGNGAHRVDCCRPCGRIFSVAFRHDFGKGIGAGAGTVSLPAYCHNRASTRALFFLRLQVSSCFGVSLAVCSSSRRLNLLLSASRRVTAAHGADSLDSQSQASPALYGCVFFNGCTRTNKRQTKRPRLGARTSSNSRGGAGIANYYRYHFFLGPSCLIFNNVYRF